MPKGFKKDTAADAIRRAGGNVDVGKAGKDGASIAVTPNSHGRNATIIAGKKTVKIRL